MASRLLVTLTGTGATGIAILVASLALSPAESPGASPESSPGSSPAGASATFIDDSDEASEASEPGASGAMLDAGEPAGDAGPWPELFEDREATGTHWRLETGRGPIHVWLPPGYRHETAGIVFYVHGYYTDVDQAWREHRLAEKFRASGRNALFIAPEAPSRGYYKVRWNDLGALIREVRARLGMQRPWGPIVAMGHSGAYRTLRAWLPYRLLDHVILLDGLYAHEAPFRSWLYEVEGKPNRLTLVAIDTLRWSELLARDVAGAPARGETRDRPRPVMLDWIPEDPSEVDDSARSAPFLYVRSQYNHMELVERDGAIPVLLQMTGLPALPSR